MRLNHIILLATMALSLESAAQTLPEFSTGNSDKESTSYYLRFTSNGSVIQDMGAGQPVKNRMPEDGADGQLWRFSGSQSSCTLESEQGRHLLYDKANNRFVASADEMTELELVATDNGQWELQIVDKTLAPSNGAVALVMNGGSGTDKIIDLWTHNFSACAMDFVKSDAMDFSTQSAPADVAEPTVTALHTAPDEPMSLWYDAPGTNWVTEALPIGGGDFGAMVFGRIAQERIQFNHKTLWRGSAGANDLGTYLNFGDLYIINADKPASVTGYRRSLDLRRAVADMQYTLPDGGTYSTEYIASHPDKVIAMHMTASQGATINIELRLINAQGNRAAYTASGATFTGTILSNGMAYAAALAIDTNGGTTEASKSGIKINGADEVTIYLACNTDFDPSAPNHLKGNADDVAAEVAATVLAAKTKGWAAVRNDHIADHSALFDRVDFALDGARTDLPTPTLLQNQSSVDYASQLDMLIFQYGRYLTIASSRGVALPSNLQGIWCKDGDASGSAVWASDIHANINVQMNYWPAEPTNLSECHMPFLDFIRNEATRADGTWQKNARDLNVSKGWVVNTAGNIFGGSSNYKAGSYSVANAWFCEHLWQHFTYTRDVDYLRTHAWPLMVSTCEFWFERLTPASNGDGTLECPNEYSPEQGRVQNATAHSQQLVTQLFINTLAAARELDVDMNSEFITTLNQKLEKIDRGLRIDSDGLLREWKYQANTPNLGADSNHFANDEQNVWQCHRHTSHLMGLYPGFEIDPGKDSEIFNAALKSLDDRGDVATGWARAWRISLWSRARNSARTYTTLRGFAHRTTSLGYDWHGGLYDNMLDAHATSVFQIEGNFGATAGIAEMLMQSRPDSLVLLPSLPEQWSSGHINGLKAIGNFEIGMTWQDGQLQTLTVHSEAGQPLTLAYPGIARFYVRTADGETVTAEGNADNLLTFPTVSGTTYIISMQQESELKELTDGCDGSSITVTDGRISVEGTDRSDIRVYDVTGREHNAANRLPSGVYAVKTPMMQKAVRIMVPDAVQ